MDFLSQLEVYSQEVDKEITNILKAWKKEGTTIHPQITPFIEEFEKTSKGGKKLRAFLVKKGYELVSQKSHPDIIKIAAAVEIMHTAILLHDDVIDKSPLRRGKPTVYKTFGSNHYAISQAISLGDIGFFLAVEEIVKSSFPPEVKVEAIRYFMHSMKLTSVGELLDVLFSQKEHAKNEQDVITITQLKTAQYTFVSPLQIGAVLGGAKNELLKKLSQFGQHVGIAFQIQDDILGTFGDEKVLGKSIYSDSEEGKNTLLINFAMEHATSSQKKVLDQYYGNGEINEKIHLTIKQIFTQTGALAYSQKKLETYTDTARKYIAKLPIQEKEKKILEQMLTFVIERNV